MALKAKVEARKKAEEKAAMEDQDRVNAMERLAAKREEKDAQRKKEEKKA